MSGGKFPRKTDFYRSSKPQSGELGYDNVSILLLLAFAAYIVTWFMQLDGRIAVLSAIRFEFSLAAILGFIALVIPRQKSEVKCNLYGYMTWLLLAMLIEVPFSYNVEYSWAIFVDRVLKFAVMTLLIVVFVRSPRAMKIFIAAFMLAWFKMGEEGFLGELSGSLVWENQGVMRLHGSTPNYEHPNSFAGLGLGMLPFIYYLFPIANRWQRIFLLVMTAFSFNIILFTGSRTGYVGFILFCIYLLLRSRHKIKFIAIILVIGVIAVPTIPDQYVKRFESITGNEAEGHSKMRRLEIWEDALTIFGEHPFGVGVSAFPTVRAERFGRTQDTHNLYLEVATNLGIQGFIVFVLLIIAIFRNIARLSGQLKRQLAALSARAAAEPSFSEVARGHVADLKLMQAMLAAASGYVVVRLGVGFFGMDLYEIYWWFTMGIVIAIHNMAQVASRITDCFLKRQPPADAGVVGKVRPHVPLAQQSRPAGVIGGR